VGRKTDIVTVIFGDRIYRIEVEERTDFGSLEKGWQVERIVRVDGMGMSYYSLSSYRKDGGILQHRKTKTTALADGMVFLAMAEQERAETEQDGG